jgi:SulP family sulfate permease
MQNVSGSPYRGRVSSHIGLARLLAYDRRELPGDLMAGVTVTAYLIPQVMAYSALAGLPAQTGLVVIVVTMTLYALIGSSRLLSVGPESTTALMTAAVLAPLAMGDPARYATLAAALALIVGAYALLAGVLRIGFIGDLLSRPVLIGYMAGVAVIMITSQLGKVTGVDVAGDSFLEDIGSFVSNAADTGPNWPTLAVGLTVAALLLVFTPRFPRVPVPLIVILLATIVVAVFDLEQYGVETVGSVAISSLTLGLPDVGTADLGLLLLPALGIFVVGYTDNILTARAFASRTNTRVHNNQEFFGMGTANVGSGLVGGFPVSSSASRTVIAEASGGHSQVYSLIAAGLVVISVLAFSTVISAFPAAALGGVVVYAAIRLIDVDEFKRLWAFRRREFMMAIAATAGVLLFDILYGVLAAVAISIVEMLTRVARPHAAVLARTEEVAGWHDVDDYPDPWQIPGLVVFRYDSPLFFANAEDFARKCRAAIDAADPPARWFLLNMEANTEVDITGLDALEEVRRYCVRHDVVMALVRVKHETQEMLHRHGIEGHIGTGHIYPTLPTAVEAYEEWAKTH